MLPLLPAIEIVVPRGGVIRNNCFFPSSPSYCPVEEIVTVAYVVDCELVGTLEGVEVGIKLKLGLCVVGLVVGEKVGVLDGDFDGMTEGF